MTTSAFEGPAGYGKTYSLMQQLELDCDTILTKTHHRVLALTYMQGSRRRLDAMLRMKPFTKGRFEAITLDSFAWRLCQRWRSLVSELGHVMPTDAQYDRTCEIAAELLSHSAVRNWVCGTYPIILVDEAQDLSAPRIDVLHKLGQASRVLVAYDEFQCLDPALRPVAVTTWLPTVCTPIVLSVPKRTTQPGLLAAATAIRNGTNLPANSRDFTVKDAAHRRGLAPTLAATLLAVQIVGRTGSFAILTPSRAPYALNIVDLVKTRTLGKKSLGPYPVLWEESEMQEFSAIADAFDTRAVYSFTEARAELQKYPGHAGVSTALAWADRRRRTAGIENFTRDELLQQIKKSIGIHRRYKRLTQSSLLAMTIHQAKNREFDHVVVIWPYQVSGDAEQQRRLLYNAVTRAKKSCLVLAQDPKMLKSPPFSA